MNIDFLPNGFMTMTADDNEQEEFKRFLAQEDYQRSPVAITQMALDVIRPMDDGFDYEFFDPAETNRGDAVFALTDGERLYYYWWDDLLPRLARGETVIWRTYE